MSNPRIASPAALRRRGGTGDFAAPGWEPTQRQEVAGAILAPQSRRERRYEEAELQRCPAVAGRSCWQRGGPSSGNAYVLVWSIQSKKTNRSLGSPSLFVSHFAL